MSDTYLRIRSCTGPAINPLEVSNGLLGEMSRVQGFTYMMHHNSHYIGQMIQAMKKGKVLVSDN